MFARIRCAPTLSRRIPRITCQGASNPRLAVIPFSSCRAYTTESSSVENVSNVSEAISNLPDASNVLARSSEAVVAATEHLGYLKSVGLCNFTPVGGIQALLEMVHVATGLPWWASIAVGTVAIRTALLPLVVKLQQNTARIQAIRPDMERISARINRAKEDGDYTAMAQYSSELRELLRKNNAKPMQLLLVPLLQAPVMISFFLALRGMSAVPLEPFVNGGLAWFTNLNMPDPYYALPIAAGAGFLAIFELGTEAGTTAGMSKNMKLFMRAMSVGMVPLTAYLPSSVFVYWITSNFFSVAQLLILRMSPVRKIIGLPLLPGQK